MSNHDKVYQNLVDVIHNNAKMAANSNDGLKTVQIIEKIYAAAESFIVMGKPIIKHSEIRDVQLVKITVIEPVNLYECKIGDNSFIGPFVEIQKELKRE
jgi:bifunctional N-acetylglucosamine-1-phosphate-uridyltransferase/glucosamine-1-phosphate-acetyltransferase GlmU-like protein